jgi:hypothetical protein
LAPPLGLLADGQRFHDGLVEQLPAYPASCTAQVGLGSRKALDAFAKIRNRKGERQGTPGHEVRGA